MHPHKVKGLQYSEKFDWDNHLIQMSGRLSSMAKRNVANTSTIESPVRHTKEGIPDNINMAVIDDYLADNYLVSNYNKRNQEVYDGSSFIDDTYARMLDASFPAKGYSGTRKQFGTLVTPNSVTIKKDAESVITNDKIRNSLKSPVSLLNKKKQMLSLSTKGIDINFKHTGLVNFVKIENGKQKNIRELNITTTDGVTTATVVYNNRVKHPTYNKYVLSGIEVETHVINNLFDL